jgi:hypothetical protein
MALQKDFIWKGITCNYWKIISYNPSFLEGVNSFVNIGLYYNKTARDADVNNFIKSEQITLPSGDYTRQDLYSLIKQEEFFTDALDV